MIIYSGQAAYISEHLDAFENPLFKAVPPGLYWPTLVLSMITSIIASQAMLTGSFQLISQAVRLGYLPKLTRVHTSKRITSQIYIPLANWFMMACALAVTIVYQNVSILQFMEVIFVVTDFSRQLVLETPMVSAWLE